MDLLQGDFVVVTKIVLPSASTQCTTVEKADELNSSTEFVPYNMRGTSRKIHPGRKSVLAQIKNELRAFTFKLCEQAVQVTNRMVMREAGRLLPGFKEKTSRAQELAVHRFT